MQNHGAASLTQQLWPDNQRCFGCGAENDLGLQLELYERGAAVASRWEPRPEYGNPWGIVHGGVLTVALDELGGTAAWLAFLRREDEEPLVVAAEITVRFRAPAKVGAPLECSPRVSELGHRHAIVEARLEAHGTEIATMVGRYVKANERPGRRAARSLPPLTGDDR